MHVVGVEDLIKNSIYLVAFRLAFFFSLAFQFCFEGKEPLSELMGKLYVLSFFSPLVFHHFLTCLHLPSLSKLFRQFPIYKTITSLPSTTWFLEQAALLH